MPNNERKECPSCNDTCPKSYKHCPGCGAEFKGESVIPDTEGELVKTVRGVVEKALDERGLKKADKPKLKPKDDIHEW